MTIDDDQLVNAADAILDWTKRQLEEGAKDVAYPPDITGTPDQPHEFQEFTAIAATWTTTTSPPTPHNRPLCKPWPGLPGSPDWRSA